MSASAKSVIVTVLEVLLHASVLIVPFFFTSVLHESDSLFAQLPDETAAAGNSNITAVGFGLRYFSIYNATFEEEDIRFSNEQKDALGQQQSAALISYYVFSVLTWVPLLVPLLLAMKNHWRNKISCLLTLSKLTKSLARVYIPLIIFFTLLMVIPFVLLTKSNLCGANYIELGFTEEEASGDSFDENYWGPDMEGTFAIVHEDIPSTCEMRDSGVAFIVSVAVWSLVLMTQAYFLSRRGGKFERDHQLATTLNHGDFSVDNAASIERDNDEQTAPVESKSGGNEAVV